MKTHSPTWRDISTDREQLQIYSDRGAELWGAVAYPVEYLLKGSTYACYLKGRMIAGFSLVAEAPLRTLSFLTPELRSGNRLFRRLKDSDFVEIAGIWYTADQCSAREIAAIFWEKLWKELRVLPQSYVIYGYNLERTGLQRVYGQFRPEILFRGPKTGSAAPSGNTQSIASIEAVPISRLDTIVPMILGRLSEQTGPSLKHRETNEEWTSRYQPVATG